MSDLTAVSLFDGIGGFPRALALSGVRTVAIVEIDKAAAGVAADHFPDAKQFDDATKVSGDDLQATGFDPERGILTGGWPCQDISLAGRRLGLGGTRSGLFWEVVRLAADLRPRWLLLENVPGLLSAVCSCPGFGACGDACIDPHVVRGGACGPGRCMELHGGAMGAVLGALVELGYGLAYRVLDAQYAGVPQQRRRVVIVGCLGDWAAPAQILLEPAGGGGDPAPGGETGSDAAGVINGSARGGRREVVAAIGLSGIGGNGGPDDNAAQGGHLIATAITAREGKGPDSDVTSGNVVTHALTSEGADASEDGTGRGTPLVPVAFDWQSDGERTRGNVSTERTSTLGTTNRDAVAVPDAVRRLTPVECERLQGFPDGWTATSYGKPQSDSARYRQLGNSIAVPVFEWVASRIVAYEKDLD